MKFSSLLFCGSAVLTFGAYMGAATLGLALFVTTFFLNYVALRVVKRYREAYE